MKTDMTTKEYTLDATGKRLGRLATEIADILRGKNEPTYQAHRAPAVTVTVHNASAIELNKSGLDKEYAHYSGYPGGLRFETREQVIEKKGYSEVLQRAVYGMLPNNKLRAIMMKNLIINE